MATYSSLLRRRHFHAFRLAVLFLWFLFVPKSASACQCAGPGPTPCQAIGPHSAIFLGVVDSIETASLLGFLKAAEIRSPISFRNQYSMYSDKVTVVFRVEEWFSGQPQKNVRLHIRRFIGACGYEYHPGDLFFHKGERYLVYAWEKDGILSTDHCSKTRHAPGKDDAEIESLRRLHGLPTSIITGTYVLSSVDGTRSPSVGASVTITSPAGQQFTTETDAEGSFTFSGLPPAKYKIQLGTPPGYAVNWAQRGWRAISFIKQGMDGRQGIVPLNRSELDVYPGACSDASYSALPDGRISGVAAAPRGILSEPIGIRIWPADHIDAVEKSWWTQYRTGPSGAFEIGPLSPGTYVIGTYIYPADFKERLKDPTYFEHFVPQPWFYPGTTDPRKAKPITVRFAQEVSGIHFVVPSAPVKVPPQK